MLVHLCLTRPVARPPGSVRTQPACPYRNQQQVSHWLWYHVGLCGLSVGCRVACMTFQCGTSYDHEHLRPAPTLLRLQVSMFVIIEDQWAHNKPE